MSHPNLREMDVARSLVDMAHVPNHGINHRNHQNLTINTNQATQAEYYYQRPYATRDQEQVIKSEYDQNGRTRATHPHLPYQHPYNHPNLNILFHPTTPASMQRSYGGTPPAPASAMMSRQRTLQDHLYRQQLLAGIAPENIVPIPQRPQGTLGVQAVPSIIQINNDGVFVPHIPPATFIPRTAYPVPPGEYNSRDSTPIGHGHFLGTHVERQPQQRQSFECERSITEFTPNAFGNGTHIGWRGVPAYNTGYQMNANTTPMYQNNGYAHGAYMAQGYFQRPTSAYTPDLNNAEYGNGSYTLMKNEPGAEHYVLDHPMQTPNLVKADPEADAQQYMLSPMHTPNFVKLEHDKEALQYMIGGPMHTHNVVKNEPEEEGQQYMLDDRKYNPDIVKNEHEDIQQLMLRSSAHILDVDYNLHAHGHAEPNHKPEGHTVGFRPDPTERATALFETQDYPNEEAKSDEPLVQEEKEVQVIDWSHPQHPMNGTLEHFSIGSQSVETPVKKEPRSEGEPAANPISLEHNVDTFPDTQNAGMTIKEKPMSVKEHEPTASAKKYHHAVDILIPLLDHREIALNLTRYLDVQDLIHLQLTSKAARIFIVKNLPKVIRLQTHRSRTASFMFPWRCYQKLWFKRLLVNDEIVPFSIPNPTDCVIAYTVSFRWLQMVKFRDRTVHSIITALQRAGYPFPRRFKSAIFKLWFLMDIPDTKRRQWTVLNRNLWTDLDLFMAIFFIIRIDMFMKIERGNRTGGQRKLIMAQPSLKFCLDVLTGDALQNDIELLAAFVRWRYKPREGEFLPEGAEVFGVPTEEIGSLQYEEYGEGRERMAKLRRPDELIIREASRRRLDFQDMYRRIFIHAQAADFVDCERPNSVWDQEMKRVTEGDDGAVQEALRLD